MVVLTVGLFIPLALLFFGYVLLRDIRKYIVWLLVAIFMIIIYKHFSELPALQMKRGSALRSFKSLICFLITFQACRLIYLRVTGEEYITPTKGGGRDIFEDRNPRVADFIMFIFLFASIIAGQEL